VKAEVLGLHVGGGAIREVAAVADVGLTGHFPGADASVQGGGLGACGLVDSKQVAGELVAGLLDGDATAGEADDVVGAEPAGLRREIGRGLGIEAASADPDEGGLFEQGAVGLDVGGEQDRAAHGGVDTPAAAQGFGVEQEREEREEEQGEEAGRVFGGDVH